MNVLIIVTSHAILGATGNPTGYYLPEVAHPYFEMLEQGIEVDIASPKGGEAPVDESSLDLTDLQNQSMWENEEHRTKLKNTISLKNIEPDDYDGILFAGGHGTMWDFRENAEVQNLVRSVYENNGYVAAVCHGPAALVDVRLSNGEYLIAGKKVTGFSNDEEAAVELTDVMPFLLETEMVRNGATYEKADIWQEKVVQDGRLITGQNPASARGVGKALATSLTE